MYALFFSSMQHIACFHPKIWVKKTKAAHDGAWKIGDSLGWHLFSSLTYLNVGAYEMLTFGKFAPSIPSMAFSCLHHVAPSVPTREAPRHSSAPNRWPPVQASQLGRKKTTQLVECFIAPGFPCLDSPRKCRAKAESVYEPQKCRISMLNSNRTLFLHGSSKWFFSRYIQINRGPKSFPRWHPFGPVAKLMFSLGDGQHIEKEPSIYIDILGLMLTCCKSHRHPKISKSVHTTSDLRLKGLPDWHQKQTQQRTYLPRLESRVFHPRCHVIEPAQGKGSFRSCPAGTPWVSILTWLLTTRHSDMLWISSLGTDFQRGSARNGRVQVAVQKIIAQDDVLGTAK